MGDPPSGKKATVTLSDSELTALPKVVLHDHLDGGLRPATILEIADATGRRMPETDAGALGAWFVQATSAGSAPRFLRAFEHTVAVMPDGRLWVLTARDGGAAGLAPWPGLAAAPDGV